MSGGGSVVVRRQLGSKLRKLRLAAGKDVVDVVTAGLGSKAKISRIETGKGPVKDRRRSGAVLALRSRHHHDRGACCSRSRYPARGLVAGLRSSCRARLVRAVRRT